MLTMLEALAKRKIQDPKLRSVKWYHSQFCRKPDRPKSFPPERDVLHRALVESQGPLFTLNSRHEFDVSYPEDSFSNRSLTAWYVAEFCRLNHLTLGAP